MSNAKKKPAAKPSAAKQEDMDEKQAVPDYEPKHTPLEHTDFDHHGAEEKRQAELQRERDYHNARTGDASR